MDSNAVALKYHQEQLHVVTLAGCQFCLRAITDLLLASILVVHVALLTWEAYCDSPTWDELAHLPTGVRYWESGQFDLYSVNPPLARIVAAFPVWLCRPRTSYQSINYAPYQRSEFSVARDFVVLNGSNALFLYRLGRLACIPFSFVGAWVCYHWARLLYGRLAGLLALTLWCFDPLVLGHGHLITCDVAAAAMAVVAAYTFWLWLREPDWAKTLSAGLFLGLAQLAKTTNLTLIAIWPSLWLLWRLMSSFSLRTRLVSEGTQLAAGFLTALVVLNAGYGFERSFTRLGDYQFVSKTLSRSADTTSLAGSTDSDSPPRAVHWNRFIGTWLENVPVPLPANYLCGIDIQKMELEEESVVSQLRGVVRRGGWWYYYLYALFVKEPLGTLVLFALAVVVPWFLSRAPDAGRNELMLLLPLLGFLILLSTQTGFTCHARYALPVLPFALILAGRLVPVAADCRPLAGVIFACVLTTVVSSLLVCPHSLSYFNEAAGGPESGHMHLLDSNIDWGQDLLYLQQWLDQHPEARPLGLAYHGTFDPKLVIPEFEKVPRGPQKGSINARETGNRSAGFVICLSCQPLRFLEYGHGSVLLSWLSAA